MTREILDLTVAEALKLYKSRALSPADMARAALARAADRADLNAICHLDEKTTMDMAYTAEKNWARGTPRPLEGITATIKDWYDVAGWPTRQGSKLTDARAKTADSLPVQALRDAGCVFIGKTTLPEFGHKGVTDSPLHGVTRNPHDPAKTSGGSSGGAAVAAACGIAQLNLGSDAGGSIRIPASFCGVVGYKPTPGLVPNFPPSLFSHLSSAGPLTRSVDDARLMTEILAGKKLAPVRKKTWRVAYAPMINDVRMNKDVAAVMARAVKALPFDVERVDLKVPSVVDVFNKHWMAVASLMVAGYTAAQKKKLDKRFLHWAARGDKLSLHDYLRAQHMRLMIEDQFKNLFTQFDILITPTTAMTAFDAGHNMPRGQDGKLWDDWTPFTYPANLARLPAISVPTGMTPAGLPVGMQIMAASGQDSLLMTASSLI